MAGPWLEQIAAASPGLEVLDVRRCELLAKTGDALAKVLRRLHLRELHCTDLAITAPLFAALRSNGDRLEVVELSSSGDVVPAVEGTPHLALSNLPALRKLDLRGDMALSDDALLLLARAEKLERLDIRGCGRVSDEAISALREARPDLAIDAGRRR